MSKSQRLRLRDLRDAYRLVGECRELGAQPPRWRHRLFEGLRELTRAQVALGGIMYHPGTPRIVAEPPVEVGWPSESSRAYWLRYQQDERAVRDGPLARGQWLAAPVLARTREQVFEDREWYRSATYNEYTRVAGIDDWLMSTYRLPGSDAVHMVTLHRTAAEPRFPARERRKVWLLHHEVGSLIGTTLRTAAQVAAEADPLAGLPPRQRQTLERLLAGDSEKQAALALGIGVRTLHQYVVMLYRRFGVSSRGELMARFVGQASPRWEDRVP